MASEDQPPQQQQNEQTPPKIYSVTVSAPTNIAVVKYWGKADDAHNTPINDSLSVTLAGLQAVTTVAASSAFQEDRLWLNGVEVEGAASAKRFRACVDGVKKMKRRETEEKNGDIDRPTADMRVHVSSYNNFPTAAGLASSAAGYAALVFGLSKLFDVVEDFPHQLSTVARQGSGSACRSLYGGLVAWRKGCAGSDGNWSNSKAEPIVDENHWPEMRALIAVVSDKQKDVGSTPGMASSVETSALLKYRAESVAPERMEKTISAFQNRDFDAFAELTIRDSNQFHATCLDTYPPIFYLNDVSRSIIRLMSAYNDWGKAKDGQMRVAYTFDAGPNAVLYLLDRHVEEVSALLKHYYHPPNAAAPADEEPWIHDLIGEAPKSSNGNGGDYELDASLLEACDRTGRVPAAGDVQRLYLTKAGPGAKVLDNDYGTLDPSTGVNTYEPPAPPPRKKQKKA